MEGGGFRDRTPEFESLNVAILGISYDTPEDNRAFVEANDFPYPLLSDPDHEVAQAYGAERDRDDPYFGYPRRITYVIDPEGVVRLTYPVAPSQIAGHVDRVLEDVTALVS